VQHERVNICTQLSDDEWHAMSHQSCGVAFAGRIGRARARKSPGDSDGLWDLVKIIKTFRETKPFDRHQKVNFRLLKRNPRDAGSAADLFLCL
jgi:hypothetical protein